MKKLNVLVSICLAALPAMAQQQLTGDQNVYEPFSDATATGGTSYAVGQSLALNSLTLPLSTLQTAANGNDVGVGIQSWWAFTNNTTRSGSPSPGIVAGDLFYPGLASSGGGQKAQFHGNGVSALMNVTSKGTAAYEAGTVYYSFTLNLSDINSLPANQSQANIIAGFTKIQSYKSSIWAPTSVGAQLWIRSDGGTGFQLGLEGGAQNNAVAATPTYGSVSYQTGDTLFIVGAYDFSSTNASLWINPAIGGAEPAADVTDTGVGKFARVASFTLFGDNPNIGSAGLPIEGAIDDLRVGLTWASVTPVPEPTTAALGALGLFGFLTMRWRRNER